MRKGDDSQNVIAINVIVEKSDYEVVAWKPADNYKGYHLIAKGTAGVDDTEVLRKAIVEQAGTVLIGCNLILKEQLNVWGGVTLDVESGYYLKNELTDAWMPCLVFKQYSGIKRLFLDCNDKSGILIGESEVVNEIKAEFVNLWNVGKSYDAVKGSQTGVKFRGYAFHVDFLKIRGGNVACDFDLCSNDYIDTALLVDFVTGMKLTACEHLFLSQIDFDTGSYAGIQIDTSHDINISGTIWVNNTAYPGVSLTYGALIGEYSSGNPNTALNLKLKFLRHGGTALKLSYTKDSIFDIEISNAELYTASPLITTGIEYGEGLSGDIVIRSDRDIDAATKISGVPYGKLLVPKVGYDKGIATITGDGVTTSFTVDVAHSLVKDNIAAKIACKKAATYKWYLVDTDADNFFETLRIEITFDTAPANGETVEIYWYADVVS